MNTAAFIRRFLTTWPLNKIFTTRSLLHFGRRSAVDTETSRLVKRGVIRRLCRGVFVHGRCEKIFSNLEVATVKAESFGRKIMVHPRGSDLDPVAYKAGEHSANQVLFGIRGYSSSFLYRGQRLQLRALISRKGVLRKTPVSRDCNKLWSTCRDNCKDVDFKLLVKDWKASNRLELAGWFGLLPAWITDEYVEWIAPVVALSMRTSISLIR